MCIIIDINIAHRIFCSSNDRVFSVVRDALYETNPKRVVTVVSGGRLHDELCTNGVVADCLKELDRAGRAKILPRQEVDQEIERLRSCHLRSDDPHVIAVARLSRARVLCSSDVNLREDFTDRSLVNHPRGKVFSSPTHMHLLKKCKPGC